MDKCETCANKTEMSEAELYCMSYYYYGYGKVYDWCREYNSALEYMEHLGYDFNECAGYENNNKNKGENNL